MSSSHFSNDMKCFKTVKTYTVVTAIFQLKDVHALMTFRIIFREWWGQVWYCGREVLWMLLLGFKS